MSLPWQTWKAQLLADKRKLSFMLALGGVALLLWGRLMLKDAPRSAVAEPGYGVSDVAADWADRAADNADAVGIVYVDLPKRIGRDLFAIDASSYERTPTSDAGGESAATTVMAVDDNQVLRQALSELRLQSTMQGEQPRAVINGQSLSPGDRVKGFKLIRVEARSVILERDGQAVRLGM